MAQSEYQISGVVAHVESGDQVTLSQYDPITQQRSKIAESEISTDGNYTLTYPFESPDLYRLDFPRRQYVMIVVDAGQEEIVVNADGQRNGNYTITGSEESEALKAYDEFRSESNARLVAPTYAAMRTARENGDVQAEIDAVAAYVKNNRMHRAELIAYTEKNIGPTMALYGTMLRWTGDDSVEKLDALVSDFEKKYAGTRPAKIMREKVERYKKVAIGAPAPPLQAPTHDGGMLSLDEIDAKYVLIDFWASWCGPCISQLPDLNLVYDDFKEMGFEILSVSVDRREDKWKQAIEKHDMDWLHISDVKGWNSELAKNYNVTFVPFNFLVDSSGKIVAKNLHSKALYMTLEELLGKS